MSKVSSLIDKWFETALGEQILETEAVQFAKLIHSKWGDHCIQMGGPPSKLLRCASPIIHQVYVKESDELTEEASLVRACYTELPFMPNSVDLVLLVHVLEWVPNPKELLAQIYSMLKPEGLLIISCFSPTGMGALWRLQFLLRGFVGKVKWHSAYSLMEKLQAVGFTQILRYSVGFQPYLGRKKLYSCFPLDKIMAWLCPCSGAISILCAKKEELAPLLRVEWGSESAMSALRNVMHERQG